MCGASSARLGAAHQRLTAPSLAREVFYLFAVLRVEQPGSVKRLGEVAH